LSIEAEQQANEPESAFKANSRFDEVSFNEIRRSSVDNAETRNGHDVMSKTLNTFGKFSTKKDQKFKIDEVGSGSPVAQVRNAQTAMDAYTPISKPRRQPDDAASQLSAAIQSVRSTKGRVLENKR
jgi:hypothetical protein